VGDRHRGVQHRRPGRQRERAYRELYPLFQFGAFSPVFARTLNTAARAVVLRRAGPLAWKEPVAVHQPALTGCCVTTITLAARATRETTRSCARSSWTSRTTRSPATCRTSTVFGPAFLVARVERGPRAAPVYLPAGDGDFWTGERSRAGGRSTAARTRMPAHVRAGSIVPFESGAAVDREKAADPVRLGRLHGPRTAASRFSRGDGEKNRHENGRFATILSAGRGERTADYRHALGAYPACRKARAFAVVFASRRGRRRRAARPRRPRRAVRRRGGRRGVPGP